MSGGAGLVDQLCFSKYLSYIVGSTAHAVSAVLAAFMMGMALGAHLGGRLSARVRRPLLAYGVLELLVGLTAALTPAAFVALTPVYVSLARATGDSLLFASVVRWSLAMLVVIVPTTAMGATLPLLSRLTGYGATRDGRARERRLGALYAANTLGGAVGALGAAYWVLPELGLRTTVFAAAGTSVVVGLAALGLGPRREASEEEVASDEGDAPAGLPLTRAWRRRLAILAFLSGALVFTAEVVSTHLLALLVGNSAFAFGLILAVFLVCLFVGASLAPLAHRRLGDHAVPVTLALAGLSIAATMPLWERLPEVFTEARGTADTFVARELVRGASAFAILSVPTLLMGLTFPLVLQRAATAPDVGRLVGRFTAINTVGAVLGSLAAGYVVLPLLGSQGSLRALAMAFAGAALWTALSVAPAGRRRSGWASAVATLGIGAAALVPSWDLARLTNGANVYFEPYADPGPIVEVHEDVHGGVTTVTRADDVTTLFTNGKFQGNDGLEMSAQRFFAHYPCLFVRDFGRALVIGLGTGTTTGTLTAYPFQHIDVVEISPSIVDAAERHFDRANRGALHDPRVSLTLADGRNHLLISEERYDLVGIELTSIWFAGAASLYSREFYALVREHLTETGILQQWVQLHHMAPRDFATILGTLRLEFEHVALFYGGGQGILVASNAPLSSNLNALRELEDTADMREVLPSDRPFDTLFRDVLLTGVGIDRYLDAEAKAAEVPRAELVSTDDNLYLEYATPRGNVLPWSSREDLVSRIAEFHDGARVDALVSAR